MFDKLSKVSAGELAALPDAPQAVASPVWSSPSLVGLYDCSTRLDVVVGSQPRASPPRRHWDAPINIQSS